MLRTHLYLIPLDLSPNLVLRSYLVTVEGQGRRLPLPPPPLLPQSLWYKANARNVSFLTLKGGQFTLSTQLRVLNYPVKLSHRRSITVSLETYQLLPHLEFRTVAGFLSPISRYLSFAGFGSIRFSNEFVRYVSNLI